LRVQAREHQPPRAFFAFSRIPVAIAERLRASSREGNLLRALRWESKKAPP
jgi:hypothetical protein